MPSPIPLNCLQATKKHIGAGTGFLVKRKDVWWLVTSVHFVSGLVNTPARDSYFKGVVMTVLDSGFRVPFEAGINGRFTVANDPSDGMFFDAVSVRLTEGEISALEGYGAYDVDSIVAAQVGQRVTMQGFPGIKTEVIPATILHADVTQVHGASIAVSKAGKVGISGGPATTDKGLIGLVQGTTVRPGEGLLTSLSTLKHVLFR